MSASLESSLEALQRSHEAYRRAREVTQPRGYADATPTVASPRTPRSLTPRMSAERELAGTIRALRASSQQASWHPTRPVPTDIYQSRPRSAQKSALEAKLLDALDTAENLEHERDELLAALARVEEEQRVGASAPGEADRLRSDADRLRSENLELTAALRDEEAQRAAEALKAEELEERASQYTGELDGLSGALADAQHAARALAVELEAERRERAGLQAALDEKDAALDKKDAALAMLAEQVEMLRCRGGGVAGVAEEPAAPPAASSAEPASNEADAPSDAAAEVAPSFVASGDDEPQDEEEEAEAEAAEGEEEEDVSGRSEEQMRLELAELVDEANAGVDGPDLNEDAAATDVAAATSYSTNTPTPPPKEEDDDADADDDGADDDAAPSPPPPPDKKAEGEVLGKLMWHGFKLPPEDACAPTSSFRLKFPPMASCLGGADAGLLVLAGGGGASRAGIPNALVFAGVSDEGTCTQTAHFGTGLQVVTSVACDTSAGVLAAVQSDAVKVYRLRTGEAALEATSAARAAAAAAAAATATAAADAAAANGTDPAPAAPTGTPEPIPISEPAHLACLDAAETLPILAPGVSFPTDADAELPPALKAYSVALAPGGSLLAVGMEDGALLLFGRAEPHDGAWTRLCRAHHHTKEIKSMAFSPSGATLASAAPDGKCLLWHAPAPTVAREVALSGGAAHLAEPYPAAKPAFSLFKMLPTLYGKRSGGRKPKKDVGAQWRCVAMPSEPPKRGSAPVALYGALNHQGGPGWVCRCDAATGKYRSHIFATSSCLTTIAVAADASIVVVGSSEGELIVLDGALSARLLKTTPHELFITNLMLRAVPPSGVGALAGDTRLAYTALTCAGDNSVLLTHLPPKKLVPRGGLGLLGWMSVLVVLLAVAMHYVPALQAVLLPALVQPLVASLLGAGVPPPPPPPLTEDVGMDEAAAVPPS